MELRQVIDILSELTGEVTNEDILNNIFSHFCIGK
jgi:tRNA modification GTPase